MSHDHQWYPLSYREPATGTSESEQEVAVWACAGRTEHGACLATCTPATYEAEARRIQKQEAEVVAEREQRHWNWEN
jgi:hypothetical protein